MVKGYFMGMCKELQKDTVVGDLDGVKAFRGEGTDYRPFPFFAFSYGYGDEQDGLFTAFCARFRTLLHNSLHTATR